MRSGRGGATFYSTRTSWDRRSWLLSAAWVARSCCTAAHECRSERVRPASCVQGQNPEPGETIAFGSPISEGSGIGAFLVWHPLVLPPEDGEIVHLSNGHLVLVQLVPIHDAELNRLRAAGSISAGGGDASAVS
jgi:hypothetical protein